MKKLRDDLPKIKTRFNPTAVYTPWDDNISKYNETRRLFNLRFDYKPAVIVMCTSTADVVEAVNLAKEYQVELRVKAGGHDHEGESSANDCILLNLEEMCDFQTDTIIDQATDEKLNVARIGPGWRFKDIVASHLDPNKISIPHGTCGTVSVAGFTLGGGWGPWTRRHGMCCDRLVGATVVLGNGEVVKLSINDTEAEKKELLWALRGGGGFGFGVVTEYVIHYFEQPAETCKFKVVFNTSPVIKVLKKWEELIDYDHNEHLLGTNLQIIGIPREDAQAGENSIHPCTFYGYLNGNDATVVNSVRHWFADFKTYKLIIEKSHDKGTFLINGAQVTASTEHLVIEHDECIFEYGNVVNQTVTYEVRNSDYSFGNWHRITQETLSEPPPPQPLDTQSDYSAIDQAQMLGLIPPDADEAAPHRITSRVVREGGFDDEGHRMLISSLQSELITKEGKAAGILQYVTLGAIAGPHYKKYKDNPQLAYHSAFPYHLRPYIVQYQVWWNTDATYRQAGVLHHVRQYTNQALDWIDLNRERYFPQVEGAFISFKDASVPTQNYFLHNYDRLVNIKRNYVKDEDNLFRSRKTIV